MIKRNRWHFVTHEVIAYLVHYEVRYQTLDTNHIGKKRNGRAENLDLDMRGGNLYEQKHPCTGDGQEKRQSGNL
jgi:hypothetical protein